MFLTFPNLFTFRILPKHLVISLFNFNFKVDLGGDAAVPRHSHTACAWNNHVALAGGLGASLHALNTVQIMDIQVRKFRSFSSYPVPLIQNKSSCKTFLIKISWISKKKNL